MKIKFSLRRYGAPSVDLMATVDATATVGDLAAHLVRVDPSRANMTSDVPPGSATLCLVGANEVALDPGRAVADSGLISGVTVAVTRMPEIYAAAPTGTPTATITVTAGPDAGTVFTVRTASAVIGREYGCDVQLSDVMVSRQHARINVGRTAEIVDMGSANGIEINDSPVTRAALRAGDVVRLGNTEFVLQLAPVSTGGSDLGAEGFIRSPRLDPVYEGRTIDAPEPPAKPQASRFPFVALMAPMLMGAALFFITKSVTSLAFVALSPLMMIGYAVEANLAGRAAYKKMLAVFRADVAALTAQAERDTRDEFAARHLEHRSLAECLEAVRYGTPLLWTRRPTDRGFAHLRLGTGRQRSRNRIVVPEGRQLPRDLLAELTALAAKYSTVDGVPVVADPVENGATGLAGPREILLAAARGLVMQASSLHSPAEFVVAAFASAQSAQDWEWLAWLPHTTSAHSPLTQRHLASTIETATALVSELEELLAARAAKDADAGPAILVLVEDDHPVDRSRLVELAEHGWEHGIHVLWLAADTRRLPAACRTYVSLGTGIADGTIGFVHSGEEVSPITVELLDAATAVAASRRLSPLVDVGARVDDDSDLPRAISLLSVSEQQLRPESAVVLERWRANHSIIDGPYAVAKRDKRASGLRAVIGRSANGDHVIDLRADGPHALVGGTTGAGKSELLQTWILALAAAYSPQRLTFLLIDYKGGSAFKDLETLPHQVGLVTDLDPHEVRRALISLYAELRRREELFDKYRVKDLIELERKKGVPTSEIPPSLVIVVDEFAALVSELPEFVDGMINVAQRGRSLGVHLILATQRPAGVIKDNLRANTNLRVALRTADEADSVDVLGSPQAAFFDLKIPGRAVSKTGPGRLVPFQTGFVGGWTRDEPDPPEIVVEELRFGQRIAWLRDDEQDAVVEPGPTDIQRLVVALENARMDASITKPSRPWLSPLDEVYNLADRDRVPNRRLDSELVFGIQDIPERQLQTPVAFRPDTDGNLAVYGTGGSGKSTLLRTIAIAAGFTIYGGACHVYGLDFGARGLASLDKLPHVGSIIVGTDTERVSRLLTWLSQEVTSRAERFAKMGAGTITSYRTVAGGDEPRILLLVDGLSAFRNAYENGERSKLFDMFCTIATDGRPVGVHILLTADRPASVPSALSSVVQTRVVLRMADENDYHGMNLPADVLKASSPPGRGMLQGTELQVAILGTRTDVGSQSAYTAELAEEMIRAGVSVAPPIPRLPEKIPLHELPPSIDRLPVLGLAATTLQPHTFVPEGMFVVSGPPLSGRTETVRAIAASLRRWNPDMRLHFLSGSTRSKLARMDLWTSSTCGAEDVAGQAKMLADEIAAPGGPRPTAIIVESIGEFIEGAAQMAMAELARACVKAGVFLVAEGESGTLTSSMPPLSTVKSGRYGIALAPDTQDGDRIYRTTFPNRLARNDFPAGRALFVYGGRTSVIQIGFAGEGVDPAYVNQ
jgi:S-DNA-T family DNA segregation ATPase FtsK/SpoIIIE